MVIVKVKQGWLEGEELPLVTGNGKYISFKGVPYATPPLGNLRFKAPKAPEPWEGLHKAFKHGPICHQYDIFTNSIAHGSEDCLYLNVYTPDVEPAAPAPVMVWIHGGGFMSGSGNSDHYSPDFIVQRGVVLVTINYRLETLGFLCLDTVDVPGNAGMKDQVEALRWVRSNISAFGGDPNNVTIFGESAGGASVGYHLISPMSVGLFRRAILMSGTPLCEWTFNAEPRKRALHLAKELGATDDILTDPKRLLLFLQAAPLDLLVNIDGAIIIRESYEEPVHNFCFNPVIEKDFGDNQYFLAEDVLHSLKRGFKNNSDVMIGYVSEESIVMIPFLIKNMEKMNRHLELFLPSDLAYNVTPAEALKLGEIIRKRYVGEKILTADVLPGLVKHSSARMFKYGILKFLQYLSKTNSSKYLYRLSCDTERNVTAKYFGKGHHISGVCHLDDLMYIFHQPEHDLPLDKNSKSYKMIQQISTLWTNFAKYGNPTPDNSLGVKWAPYTEQQPTYLDIGELLTAGTNLEEDEFKFWERIYSHVG